MTELVLKAEVREGLGKEANKKLRKLGIVPAVFYQKQQAQSIQINLLEFAQVMRAGEQLIDLSVDGKKKKALIKDIQFHPVTEDVVHIDFQGVSMSEIVQVNVPLNFVGSSAGVREGGLFDVARHELEIKCKASDIPSSLDVNIEELLVGDSVHVKDLDFGDLEIVTGEDLTICAVVAPKVFKDDEEAVEGEEGLEGEEGAEETEEEAAAEE